MDRWQHTVKKTVSFAGIGLHSGQPVKLYVKPAPANSGIRFLRSDIAEDAMIPASLYRVSDTLLATTIAKDEAAVSTTEHLLAALVGMGCYSSASTMARNFMSPWRGSMREVRR